MKCPSCGYKWKPNIKPPNKPKACPSCKRYLPRDDKDGSKD